VARSAIAQALTCQFECVRRLLYLQSARFVLSSNCFFIQSPYRALVACLDSLPVVGAHSPKYWGAKYLAQYLDDQVSSTLDSNSMN
jgi:hypothetical protein